MHIDHNSEKHKFAAIADDGKDIGYIEYKEGPDGNLHATHTVVRPEFSGVGMAKQLLGKLVELAESRDVKIIPECSYVKGAFKKDPDLYKNVMP